MAVLRTAQDFHEITVAYLQRAKDSGVRHVELFFDPQAQIGGTLGLCEVVAGIRAGLADGLERWNISSKLIACFWRNAPATEAMELMKVLVEQRHDIDGIGLDSSEVGFPPQLFTEVFDYARAHGLHVVAHAGDEGPAEYIWQALDLLKVQRVDHGIRSLDDPLLIQRLIDEQMPLTVCPLSNIRLRAVDTMAEHPLPRMLAQGLKVSVHSDDPAYFGGCMDANFDALMEQFAFSTGQLATLAKNSFESSFLDEPSKQARIAEVRAWAELQK